MDDLARQIQEMMTQPSWTGDPLAGACVTVMGLVAELLAADLEPMRASYLARHAHAAAWMDLDD